MRRVTDHSKDPRGRPERTWAGEMPSAQPNASLAISADRRIDVTNSRVIPTDHGEGRGDQGRAPGHPHARRAQRQRHRRRRGAQQVSARSALMIDQKDLKRVIIRNGLPGNTTRTIEYLVKG